MNTWILWRFGSWDRKHRKVIYCCPNKASSTLTVKLSSWSIHRAFGVMWPMQGNLRDGELFSAEYFSLVSIRQSFFECIMSGTEQTCNVKLLFHLSLPQHNILLIMWEFNTMHPKNTCFPFLLDPPSHPCASPPKEKQNRQTKSTKSNLSCLYTHWSMAKVPVASPLIKTESPMSHIRSHQLWRTTLIITVLKMRVKKPWWLLWDGTFSPKSWECQSILAQLGCFWAHVVVEDRAFICPNIMLSPSSVWSFIEDLQRWPSVMTLKSPSVLSGVGGRK